MGRLSLLLAPTPLLFLTFLPFLPLGRLTPPLGPTRPSFLTFLPFLPLVFQTRFSPFAFPPFLTFLPFLPFVSLFVRYPSTKLPHPLLFCYFPSVPSIL